MSLPPTFVDIMRHGEPEGGSVLRGHIDHELTQKGWWQAQSRVSGVIAAESKDSPAWDVIVSSPLNRCLAFANKIAAQGIAVNNVVQVDDAWRELHYGDWEGISHQRIWQEQSELMEKMWQAPLEFCAPNGEAVKDFSQRIEQAWETLLKAHQGKRILLVCHGGVMRVLLQQLLLMAPEGMNRFAIPYAAMSRFRVDHAAGEKNNKTQHWPSLLCHLGNEINHTTT